MYHTYFLILTQMNSVLKEGWRPRKESIIRFTCKVLKILNRYAKRTVALSRENIPSNQVVPKRHVSTAHTFTQYLRKKVESFYFMNK